ncbi:MAG: hypothetical protein QXL89_04355 [Nitrososphaeria archaeon]
MDNDTSLSTIQTGHKEQRLPKHNSGYLITILNKENLKSMLYPRKKNSRNVAGDRNGVNKRLLI